MIDLPKNSYNTKSKAYKNSHKFISTRLADLVKVEIDTNNFDIAVLSPPGITRESQLFSSSIDLTSSVST